MANDSTRADFQLAGQVHKSSSTTSSSLIRRTVSTTSRPPRAAIRREFRSGRFLRFSSSVRRGRRAATASPRRLPRAKEDEAGIRAQAGNTVKHLESGGFKLMHDLNGWYIEERVLCDPLTAHTWLAETT